MKTYITTLLLFLGALTLSAQPKTTTNGKKYSAQVEKIFSKLTPEEKLAQLYSIRTNELTENGKLSLEKCRKLIPNGIGHLAQYASGLAMSPNELRDFVRELQHYLQTETPSGIPAIFHEEALTGLAAAGATVFPQSLGVACTWNPTLAEKKTEYTAQTMRDAGSVFALSPMIDIIRNPHWNRLEESNGEDAYLGSAMGLAFVKGLQKQGFDKGVAACTKHFLGYGGGSENDDKVIYEEILMPHEVAIRLGGSKGIMTGYHEYKDGLAVSSKVLLQDILRDRLGFDGIVVSDYGAVTRKMGKTETNATRAADAINAGNDLEFSEGRAYPNLPQLIKDGVVTQERFDEAVKQALTLKYETGMLDKNAKFGADGDLNFDKPEHRKLAYEIAAQSIVLLKNNGILPLKDTRKIALVGPNANSYWAMLGDYTYQALYSFWWGGEVDPNNPKIVDLYDALLEKLPKTTQLGYERGIDWSQSSESKVAKGGGDPRLDRMKELLLKSTDPTNSDNALKLASNSDVIIAAMGENVTLCGEGRERKGIKLPGDQEAFVKKLIATGKPVILVVFGGRAQVVTDLIPQCAAVIQAWYPGEEGGNAVADILLGNVNPSGKLCVTYPKTEQFKYLCYNDGYENVDYLYPFGYGLSYTTYEYKNLKLQPQAKTTDKWFDVTFELKNSGKREGTEICQLYVFPKGQSKPGRVCKLQGFDRITLKPGESKKVTMRLATDQLAYYDNGQFVIEPGRYEIKVGRSATDLPLSATIEIGGEKTVMKNRTKYFSQNR